MATIADLERANDELRAAVEGRIAAAEAACCEGSPLCHAIDTRVPLPDPSAVIADGDEGLDAPRCVNATDPAAMERAWASVKARYQAIQPEPEPEPEPAERRPRVFSSAGPVEAAPTPAESLLRTAIDTIRDRRGTYGPPQEHFRITVGLLNAAFADKFRRRLDAGELPFSVDDWPIVMALDKIARDMGPRPSLDTPIDLAGYAATLAECRQP
jgi:hypothetical protein